MKQRLRSNLVLLCLVLCVCCLGAARVWAQGALPATAPTTLSVSQLPSARPTTGKAAYAPASALDWDGHLLQVHAGGAGLNDLLRSIAVKTGTEIVGSVPEDRIFGEYGPAPTAEVLAELLDGMPVNVLFVDRTANKPAALTLTARNGAATPPMPQSDVAVEPAQPAVQPAQNSGFVGRRFGGGNPATGQAQPMEAPNSPADVPAASPTESPAASSNPASPNGVKTPEEIFEQLQRLRATSTKRQ